MSRDLTIAINETMRSPEELALVIHYLDKEKKLTRRVVSPIRWAGKEAFLALCLCRETPRRFDVAGVYAFYVMDAADVLMPVEIVEIELPKNAAKPA